MNRVPRSAEDSGRVPENSGRGILPAAGGPVNLLQLAASTDAGPFNQVFVAGYGHRARLTLTTCPGPWHHPDTPETFIVLEGLLLDFRDGAAILRRPSMAFTVWPSRSPPE